MCLGRGAGGFQSWWFHRSDVIRAVLHQRLAHAILACSRALFVLARFPLGHGSSPALSGLARRRRRARRPRGLAGLAEDEMSTESVFGFWERTAAGRLWRPVRRLLSAPSCRRSSRCAAALPRCRCISSGSSLRASSCSRLSCATRHAAFFDLFRFNELAGWGSSSSEPHR